MIDNGQAPEQPAGEFILYTTDDGNTRVECRFEEETIWLSQALMAELFDRSKKTISEHLQNLFEEEEISANSVVRNFQTTAADSKTYKVQFYNDVSIAKNYLNEEEIDGLNRIVTMWLDFAEDQAKRRKQVFLTDWQNKLDSFLEFNDRNVLKNAGSRSNSQAKEHAEAEYQIFANNRRRLIEAEAEKTAIDALEQQEKGTRNE